MHCKHLNGLLTEIMDAVHEREFREGKLEPEGYNEMADITGYSYSCRDCGNRFYFSNPLKAPKWFQGIYEQLKGGDRC